MSGYIQKFAILFIGIMLFFLLPTSLFAQETISLNEAVNSNLVEVVKISGRSSSYYQPMVVMEIRNLSNQPLEIDLPLGSRLNNKEGTACNLVVLRSKRLPIYLEVLPSDSPPVPYGLFTYCLELEGQDNFSYPSHEATYQLTGELVADDIISVLRNIEEAREEGNFAAQIAIWSVAKDYDLAQLENMQGANYSFQRPLVERFLGLDQVTPTASGTMLAEEQASAPITPPDAEEEQPISLPDAEGAPPNNELMVFALVVGAILFGGLVLFAFMVRQPKHLIAPSQPASSKNSTSDEKYDSGQKNRSFYSRQDRCVLCGEPLDVNGKCSNKACSIHRLGKGTVKTVDESTDAIPVDDEPFEQTEGKRAGKRRHYNQRSPSAFRHFRKVVDTEPLNTNRATGYHEPTDAQEVEDNLSIKFKVLSGNQKGQSHEISGNNQDLQAIISRGEAEQIVLNDSNVSMPHAVLDVWPDNPKGDRIRDLGSKNGTWVNGRRLPTNKWHPLKEGDHLEFGITKLRYDQAERQLTYEEQPTSAIRLIGETNRWLITRYEIEIIDFNSNDTKISVPHVCVRLNKGSLEVRDISSNNAVKIEGKAVKDWTHIFDQDIIQIGQHTNIRVITDISGIPEVIDQWRRQYLIKHGGMASIYHVEHIDSGQIAALKIPRPSNYRKENDLGQKYKQLFEQECTLTHRIQDPNLVQEIDHGFIQNGVQLPYLVLEYIDGYSVYKMIEKLGTFSLPDAAEIAFWVANALQALHKENYIHCDVKPSNMMIDRQGKVYLIDLGVATRIGETYSTLGRQEYLPKEIYSDHEPVNVDTDVYSLGQTLFKMLTTQSLPSGRLVADEHKDPGVENTTLISTSRTPLALPSLLRQKVKSAEAQTIIVNCTKENRQERYQDMQDLIDDLEPLRLRANLRALIERM